MTRRPRTHEFTAQQTRELLAQLDQRLRDRGVAASIFVVGGAAVAATGARGNRVTQDVDALTDNNVVLEEARVLARERGLPEGWLNRAARMWMPPLPRGVLDPSAVAGLRVTYADDGFLLATKLVEQRAKDVDDVICPLPPGRAGHGERHAARVAYPQLLHRRRARVHRRWD